MCNVIEVANAAQLVVNGFAYTRDGDYIRVLDLNNPSKAVVIDDEFEVLETSMNDIEIDIVLGYYIKNKKYMEIA